ncbi:hypothetical protein B0H14DRAFT_3447615 [Mycena olivaceomarginata]|nr:hypothetical protein B0H14DRAFT_3447615 [Mycena olivaceomarginata]
MEEPSFIRGRKYGPDRSLSTSRASSCGTATTLSPSSCSACKHSGTAPFSAASTAVDREYAIGPHSALPVITRIAFARSNADGWRDGPGFNGYFLRVAFPATAAEAKGEEWELIALEAEKVPKNKQLKVAARTMILLGIHGNGLTHLIMMQPTHISTVIEMFYPEGFAHNYQWTMRAFGVYETFCRLERYMCLLPPPYASFIYTLARPGNFIPAHRPAVAQLIEDRVEGRL